MALSLRIGLTLTGALDVKDVKDVFPLWSILHDSFCGGYFPWSTPHCDRSDYTLNNGMTVNATEWNIDSECSVLLFFGNIDIHMQLQAQQSAQ